MLNLASPWRLRWWRHTAGYWCTWRLNHWASKVSSVSYSHTEIHGLSKVQRNVKVQFLLTDLFWSKQASCCQTCLSVTRGGSCTRYWRCLATGCTTSSHITESSCSVTCTVWLPSPRPTRTSCICGNAEPRPRASLLSMCFQLVAFLSSVESTALRLITALGSSEVQPQFTRFLSDPKTVLSAESEELNRALILTLARATHVTGMARWVHSPFSTAVSAFPNLTSVCVDFFTGSDSIHGTWCKDILQTIMNFTPHNWASHTLSCFPAPLQVHLDTKIPLRSHPSILCLKTTPFPCSFSSGFFQTEQRSPRVTFQPEKKRGRGVQEVEIHG